MTTPTRTLPAASGGAKFRALLADLDWVRQASPAELRAAVHALCWRSSRAVIDGLAADPRVAARVLICARAIRDELDARLDSADVSEFADPATLRRRRAAVVELIAACDAAVQDATLHAVSDLTAAITEHRRRVTDAEVREADVELWRVLDTAAPHRSSTAA